MDQLTNSSRGLRSIETISGSSYLLDLDSGVILRQADPYGDEDGTLRRDGGPIQLIRLLHCEVGGHMLLPVNLKAPGVVWTPRISTTVLRIEGVDPRDPSDAHLSRQSRRLPSGRRGCTPGHTSAQPPDRDGLFLTAAR